MRKHTRKTCDKRVISKLSRITRYATIQLE